MSDNTALPVQSGGDTIRTDEAISYATGTAASVKTQVMKVATGGQGVDGGLVTALNPFPVRDDGARRELEIMNTKLDALIELLQKGG